MPEGSPFMTPFQPSSSLGVSPFTGSDPYFTSGRQRFHVELKEATNVVSWKKLLKSAPPPPAVEAPPGANPALEARLAPETALLSKEPRSAPNRFSNVIEKIERLYQGQGQESDDDMLDNTLDNVPDDDQYNTDDSFIDDKELDEYFSVDKAKTKHSGFFINKGKLENISDPSPPPVAIPKKRKRKDPKNEDFQKQIEDFPKKIKAGKADPLYKENIEQLCSEAETSVRVGECMVNKQADSQVQQAAVSDGIPYHQLQPNGRSSDITRPLKTPDYSSKASSMFKSKGLIKTLPRPKGDQSAIGNGLSVRKNISGSPSRPKVMKQYMDKDPCKMSSGTLTSASTNPKDESIPKRPTAPKLTLLERAIQDLKAGVAQLRPSVPAVQETDQASIATGKTRRLPREIKQKIAKVARLAAKQGKIPDELIDRLMSILGHLMQLKTLKRNLKEMVEMGLAAKQEKEGRLSHMKREFTEMVRLRVSSMQVKGEDEHFDDFQGIPGSSDKKSYYKWDQATEDRICDLYDQYLEGTDENKGVQSRKLYIELAELWPEGWMDKDGIKNAVYRAKERKKALQKQSLNEAKKKFTERIDLNDRLPEGFLALPPTHNPSNSRDLPSSALQSGKPAIIRSKQAHRALLDKHMDFKDKKRYLPSAEEPLDDDGRLAFLKFRKQKAAGSGDQIFDTVYGQDKAGFLPPRPIESISLDGSN